jgi:hypothetical protein
MNSYAEPASREPMSHDVISFVSASHATARDGSGAFADRM